MNGDLQPCSLPTTSLRDKISNFHLLTLQRPSGSAPTAQIETLVLRLIFFSHGAPHALVTDVADAFPH